MENAKRMTAAKIPAQVAAEIAACREAISRQPDDVRPYGKLARIFAQLGNLDRAAQIYRKMLQIRPEADGARAGLQRIAGAQRARADALRRQNKTEEAIAEYHKAIALNPGDLQSHLALGGVLFKAGKNHQAANYWRKAVSIDPKCFPAYMNLGLVLPKLKRSEMAIDFLRQAVALQPGEPRAYAMLGRLCKDERRFEEAEAAFQKRLELEPGSLDGVLNLTAVYERTGKVKEAYHLLRPLIDAGNDDVAVVSAYAIVCHRMEPPPEDAVPLLLRHADRTGLEDAVRRKIFIGLAQLCDVLGRFDEAFRYYERAHDLDTLETGGKRGEVKQIITDSEKAYSAERLARLPRARHGSELPVFIVGMPRTGTTLTEQIVSSHPQVFGAGELKDMAKFAVALGRRAPYPQCLDQITQQDVEQTAAEYLAHLRSLAPGALRVTDKMPFNFSHLGLIETLFPRARVIHCMRHPLDTCVSVYFNEISNFTMNHDQPSLAGYYRNYWELMRYWQQVLSIPIFNLRYEDMVAKPEEMTRRLIEFCGLEWNDACLAFTENKRYVDTLSYYQVRKPIYTRSVERYKAYDPYIGPLRTGLADIVAEYEAG
ncbi:MAG: sulfotransferase [Betaproteobacteria bacterium]|nr:sulfotransferase [Betaproteobacteria bacterium]